MGHTREVQTGVQGEETPDHHISILVHTGAGALKTVIIRQVAP